MSQVAPSDVEAFPPQDSNSPGPPGERSPVAVALEWVSRITTVALMMVLPGVAGAWLDGKFGTRFLALLGFALGVSAGVWQLIVISRTANAKGQKFRRSSTAGRSSPPDQKDVS